MTTDNYVVTKSMLPQDPLHRFRLLRHPWVFLCTCVYTRDQVSESNPIKPFPVHKPYFYPLVKAWQDERLIVIEKSRRMTISWLYAALFLHDALIHPEREIFFQSDKQEKADELVERAHFIYKNIPKDVWPEDLLPKARRVENLLKFKETNSAIHAVAMGADQLRQYTASGIFMDEFGFWRLARESYTASRPTAEGGGRVVIVCSTPPHDELEPSFFIQLVDDTIRESTTSPLSSRSTRAPLTTYFPDNKPLPGLQMYKNPRNKFLSVQLHYTADPAKRSEEWKRTNSEGMPKAEWDREYELKRLSFTGTPVYGSDFQESQHILRGSSQADAVPGLPLILGIDWGLTPACIILQYVPPRCLVLDELVGNNIGAERFVPIIRNFINTYYPGYRTVEFVDPAGWSRSQTDESRCVEIMYEHGFDPAPGELLFGPRKEAVSYFLTKYYEGKPCLLVNERCEILIKGFLGGYRYPDKGHMRKDRPLKNEYSHPHDALQYALSGIKSGLYRDIFKEGAKIRIPRYGKLTGTYET